MVMLLLCCLVFGMGIVFDYFSKDEIEVGSDKK